MSTIPFSDVAAEEPDGTKSNYLLSLTKVIGKKVIDVEGYISTEFGDKMFEIVNIVLEDGKRLSCGGEHDMPYIEDDIPNLEEIEDND